MASHSEENSVSTVSAEMSEVHVTTSGFVTVKIGVTHLGTLRVIVIVELGLHSDEEEVEDYFSKAIVVINYVLNACFSG